MRHPSLTSHLSCESAGSSKQGTGAFSLKPYGERTTLSEDFDSMFTRSRTPTSSSYSGPSICGKSMKSWR